MSRPETMVVIKDALQEYRPDGSGEITAQTRINELGLDSIDFLEMLLKIEERLDREIDVVAFEKCVTIADAIDYLESIG